MGRLASALLLSLSLGGCAVLSGAFSGPRYEVPAGPRTLRESTPDERLGALQRAQVWRAVPTPSLDLLAGPPGADAFAFDQEVTCDYSMEETAELGGETPKFACTVAPGDTVKVKYGPDNGEVYAEVAASRLLWALGFGTDRIYPVKVRCRGCPADPWKERAPEPGAERLFDPAVIERPADLARIEVKGARPGWAWWELGIVSEAAGGAPPAHLDALRLLAAFVQHSDSKDEQQTLGCLPGAVVRRPDGSEACARPFLLVRDAGNTFSRADLRNRNKFEFDNWSTVPVWRDPAECVAQLKRSVTGTMGHPRIGEPGRAFLASLLVQLSDAQVRDLFRATRLERRGEQVEEEDGTRRAVTVEDWARAFARRRDAIVQHRCPR